MKLRSVAGANILAIERNRKFSREVLCPVANTELQAGDVLLIDLFAPGRNVEKLLQQFALERMPLSGAYFSDRSQEIGMAEVIVPPTSELVDRTVVESKFRPRCGLTVIGLRRGDPAHEGSLLSERLLVGEMLLPDRRAN